MASSGMLRRVARGSGCQSQGNQGAEGMVPRCHPGTSAVTSRTCHVGGSLRQNLRSPKLGPVRDRAGVIATVTSSSDSY
jgi:hypothetical protein